MHNYTKRKTFFVFRNTLSCVDIEQLNVLDQGRKLTFQAIQQRLKVEIVINDNGEVTNNWREFRHLGIGRNPGGSERCKINFKYNRWLWQIVFLNPLRMKFADAANRAAVEQHVCRSTGMKRRMQDFFETNLFRRQQSFQIAFHVIEINLACPATPPLGQRAP